MSYADFQNPVELLRSMAAESQTIRGIVANPLATKEALAVILDGGTVAVGDTASRIVWGPFDEDPESPKYIARPRVSVQQAEETFSRGSSSSFVYSGLLYLLVECDIPPDLLTDREAAERDADYKHKWIAADILALLRQSGRLDIAEFSPVAEGRLSDPKGHGEGDDEQYMILDYTVRCQG